MKLVLVMFNDSLFALNHKDNVLNSSLVVPLTAVGLNFCLICWCHLQRV